MISHEKRPQEAGRPSPAEDKATIVWRGDVSTAEEAKHASNMEKTCEAQGTHQHINMTNI